jgi:hypothetical protein
VLSGGDLLAGAQTGTGKTAGFTLPLLQRLSAMPRNKINGHLPIRALILAPTRELAAQVEESVRQYGKYLPLTSACIFGGVGINPQITLLKRGVDILVATPGRLLDHMQQGTVNLSAHRDPGAGRSRPHAGHGLHPRHPQGARRPAAQAPEPAVLGHLRRRDQGAGRQPAEQPGPDRSGPPQLHRGSDRAEDPPGRPRQEAPCWRT